MDSVPATERIKGGIMPNHGIITGLTGLWLRVISGARLLRSDSILEEFQGGPYKPAFLDYFFSGMYRVEVRRLNEKWNAGRKSDRPLKTGDRLSGEVLRFSNAKDQYTVRISGDAGGWLAAFTSIGLIIGNSRKMAKRLVELVRLTSAWAYRPASVPLAIEVIDYDGPETDVDGISAISQELFIECVRSNKGASREWRRAQIGAVKSGKTAVVSLRIITPMGLIKGNALVLPKWMMGNMDVRTFEPNIKREIRSDGWFWVTVEPSYGAIPVKSDDLTHAIYRNVNGLYDDHTMLGSFRSMLLEFFKDLKSGKRSEWMESLADNVDDILHEDSFSKHAKNRGLVGRIQLAVAQLAAVGVPLTASQSLMFLSVNGLKKQVLGDTPVGDTWKDKSKRWFPVPWAYAAHVMTQEALRVFGFYIPETDKGFFHQDTHCFVVPGKFFAENYENHGGYDLDDTIKVHVRQIVASPGDVPVLGAFLLRNPNDFGEWSWIEIDEIGPVFHKYGEEPPKVVLQELMSAVPQWTTLKSSVQIGQLPAMTNPCRIGDIYSREDEERVRRAAQAFPAGVGGTVIPKMIWYATVGKEIPVLCAPNEDIIDVLQQGQGSEDDIKAIQGWIDRTMSILQSEQEELDAFWWTTRLPRPYKEAGWGVAPVEESTWVELHHARESKAREAIKIMVDWLNEHVTMPEMLDAITWSKEELDSMQDELTKIQAMRNSAPGWPERFAEILSEADESKGEAYVDRKVLRLAYASLKAKKQWPRANHDQWLFSFTKAEKLPVDWYIRAIARLQDDTYNW
jgi:hypothetical protein